MNYMWGSVNASSHYTAKVKSTAYNFPIRIYFCVANRSKCLIRWDEIKYWKLKINAKHSWSREYIWWKGLSHKIVLQISFIFVKSSVSVLVFVKLFANFSLWRIWRKTFRGNKLSMLKCNIIKIIIIIINS